MSAPEREEAARAARRYARVHELFAVVSELPPEEHLAWLEAHCAEEADLRAEVLSLLAHDTEAEEGATANLDGLVLGALEEVGALERPVATLPLPERIGSYEITGIIGHGGMGIVYAAMQKRPRRSVALKIIRAELGRSEALERFELEAELLGRLQHPGIAQIHESGTFESGAGIQPWIAMERIEGVDLSDHVRISACDLTQRIDLLIKLCDAIHHAHQRGIIHRDLKPDNILVDHEDQPKILDFGVAHVVDQDAQAGLTDPGQVVGTLAYMSPEQICGGSDGIGVASDVYAIGVIAFEVLAGSLPHDLQGLSLTAATHVICEQVAPAMSSVDRTLRGDLETIVAKALEKEPGARYASAAALADDLRRLLSNEPIHARPATLLYQLRRFARRHRVLVGGVLATMIVLVAGIITALIFAAREADQRRLAEAAGQEADARTREARELAYRSLIAAAFAAQADGNLTTARQHLSAAPTEYRDWCWSYLDTLLPIILTAQSQPTEGLAFMADGRGIVSALEDGRVAVWDLSSGTIRYPWIHEGQVRVIALDRTGSRLAGGTEDGRVLIWDVEGGEPLGVQRAHEDAVRSLVWSKDGAALLSCDQWTVRYSRDGASRVIDGAASGSAHYNLALSPADETAVFVAWGLAVQLWDLATDKTRTTNKVDFVHTARFGRDGQRLYLNSRGDLRVYDAQTRKLIESWELHRHVITGLAVSTAGDHIATAAMDRTVKVVDATTGEVLRSFQNPGSYGYPRVAFDGPGNRVAATRQKDRSVVVWDLSPREPLVVRALGNTASAVVWGPQGSRLAVLSEAGRRAHVIDASHGTIIRTIDMPFEGRATLLVFSEDGLSLLLGGRSGRIHAVEVATGRVAGVGADEAPPETHLMRLDAWRGGRRASNEWVLDPQAPRSYSIRSKEIWVREGDSYRALVETSSSALALALSPDGRTIAAPTTGGLVDLRDARSGQLRGQLPDVGVDLTSADYSSSGRRLAIGQNDGGIRIWDATSKVQLMEIQGHETSVAALAFGPQGLRLAALSENGTLLIHDARRR